MSKDAIHYTGGSSRIMKLFTISELFWMAVLVLCLSLAFGWRVAVLLSSTLIFHEVGHAWAMIRYGLGIQSFVFIPFVGAAVAPIRSWSTRWQEAVVALMGPVWGLVMTVAFLVVYLMTGNRTAAGMTALVAFVNLFNLIPINPLDGGRVVKSIGHSVWGGLGLTVQLLGLVGAVGIGLYASPVIGALVFYIALIELKTEIRSMQRVKDIRTVTVGLSGLLGVDPDRKAITEELDRLALSMSDRERGDWVGSRASELEGCYEMKDDWGGTGAETAVAKHRQGISGVDFFDLIQLYAYDLVPFRKKHLLFGKDVCLVSYWDLNPNVFCDPTVPPQFRSRLDSSLAGNSGLIPMTGTEPAVILGCYLLVGGALLAIYLLAVPEIGLLEFLKSMR